MAVSDNKSALLKSANSKSARYQVGYGRPPLHTRFQKGRSGNPGGRPSRKRVERMRTLALREAYRAVAVKEAGCMVPVTAIAAILRSQIELAANGNLQAQRDILAMVRSIEKENKGAAEIAAVFGERDKGHAQQAKMKLASDIYDDEFDTNAKKLEAGQRDV